MTERMGLVTAGRQDGRSAEWAGRAELGRAAAGWRRWQWDLQAAGPFCTVH